MARRGKPARQKYGAMHMKRNSQQVASVDINNYIEGIHQFVRQSMRVGFEPYIATFLFRSLPSSEVAAKNIMVEEIRGVYGRFLTEVVRNPWSEQNRCNRPILIGCPDWPVAKGIKGRIKQRVGATGIHFAGVLLIPPVNRLKRGVADHFKQKQKAYVWPGRRLERIHIDHIDGEVRRAVDYTFKSLKRRRCEIDDVILLPWSKDEKGQNH
jgi:hypothetical protein